MEMLELVVLMLVPYVKTTRRAENQKRNIPYRESIPLELGLCARRDGLGLATTRVVLYHLVITGLSMMP